MGKMGNAARSLVCLPQTRGAGGSVKVLIGEEREVKLPKFMASER